MSWHLEGTVLIACNCDWGCPCNVNGRPTHGDCEGGWLWSINQGSVDGVDLRGRAVAVFADWPGAIHDGGGQASAYIDDGANDDQAAVLTRVVRGEAGGPWAIFIETYALAGPLSAAFAVTVDAYASAATIEGVAELEMQPISNPVTGVEIHPELALPEGLITQRVGLGASKVFRVHDGVTFDHSGRYAAFGPFSYRG